MNKIVIFDLDGTLADITARRKLATKDNGKLDWDVFLDRDNIKLDVPNQKVVDMARMINESENLGEGINRIKNILRMITETESLAEAKTIFRGLSISINETEQSSETFNRLMNIVKLFNETLEEAESNNKYRDMTRKLDETVQETENVGRLASLSNRNSIRPRLASPTLRAISSGATTVPARGLGIRPRGPKI